MTGSAEAVSRARRKSTIRSGEADPGRGRALPQNRQPERHEFHRSRRDDAALSKSGFYGSIDARQGSPTASALRGLDPRLLLPISSRYQSAERSTIRAGSASQRAQSAS